MIGWSNTNQTNYSCALENIVQKMLIKYNTKYYLVSHYLKVNLAVKL